jgi:L-threonylcarbamoyladenylate synthase
MKNDKEEKLSRLAPSALRKLVSLLQEGELIAFPTETVYALAGDARNLCAVKKIFALKKRPLYQPLSVLLPQGYDLNAWASGVPAIAEQLADCFWPGPLTLILNKNTSVLSELVGGQAKIGLRVPDHPIAQAILHAFSGGLAAPSANRSTHLSPTQAEHVREEFGGQLANIVEGGTCSIGIESTIVDVTATIPRIVRVGAISEEAIQNVIHCRLINDCPVSHRKGRIVLQQLKAEELQSAILDYLNQGKSVTVLARYASTLNQKNLIWIEMPKEAADYARVLYTHLHEIEQNLTDEVLVEALPSHGGWAGVRTVLERLVN